MKSLKLTGRLIFSAFYFLSGLIMLIILVLSNGTLIHVGVLGALSIVASYGLTKMRRWALYSLIILLFSGITFGVITIYSSTKLFDLNLITLSLQTVIVLYLTLLVISFFDALSDRAKFE